MTITNEIRLLGGLLLDPRRHERAQPFLRSHSWQARCHLRLYCALSLRPTADLKELKTAAVQGLPTESPAWTWDTILAELVDHAAESDQEFDRLLGWAQSEDSRRRFTDVSIDRGAGLDFLGSLIECEQSERERLAVLLSRRDFFDPKHGLVFGAIMAVSSRSQRVTQHSLTAQLQRMSLGDELLTEDEQDQGQLCAFKAIGGPRAIELLFLWSGLPYLAWPRAEVIKKASRFRSLSTAARRLSDDPTDANLRARVHSLCELLVGVD